MKILIVEDHPLLSDVLTSRLRLSPGVDQVLQAISLKQGYELIVRHQPDLLILDLSLPDGDGSSLLPVLSLANESSRAIVLSADPLSFRYEGAAGERVVAILDKKTAHYDHVAALVQQLHSAPTPTAEPSLDPAEIQQLLLQANDNVRRVLHQLGDGCSTKQIAEQLHLSARTVESYRKQLAELLGVSGAALIRAAVLHNLWLKGQP